MIGILNKYNFKTVELFPINYHPATPKIFRTQSSYLNIEKYITKNYNKLSLIPFSSTFIIVAKKC